MMRRRLFQVVERGRRGDGWARSFHWLIIGMILLTVAAVIAETVKSIYAVYGPWFERFEVVAASVFTFEYVARLWTCVDYDDPRYKHWLWGRLRYAVSPLSLIDLMSVLPFYINLFYPLDPNVAVIWRLVRMLKLMRHSAALEMLWQVICTERQPLFAAFEVMMVLLVTVSGVVYLLEKDAQPAAFASMPHALWWGIVTLMTVGYGDVVPITPLGRLVGGGAVVLGLGMFALPAGILASGFAQEVKKRDFVVSWNLVIQVPFFAHLPAVRIAEIVAKLRPRITRPRERIVRRGEAAECMYFIVAGEIEVLVPNRSVRLSDGDFFGEIALLERSTRTATVMSVGHTQLLMLDVDDLLKILDDHPHLKSMMIKVAHQRLTATLAASPPDDAA